MLDLASFALRYTSTSEAASDKFNKETKMILKEFSDFLKTNEQKPSVSLLFVWLKQKIETPAKSNVDKILQKEIYIAKNKAGHNLFIGKSPSGRNLMQSLYNFALSFEQQKMARWLHDKKANDFKNCKE